jgi:hypothetical protein
MVAFAETFIFETLNQNLWLVTVNATARDACGVARGLNVFLVLVVAAFKSCEALFAAKAYTGIFFI